MTSVNSPQGSRALHICDSVEWKVLWKAALVYVQMKANQANLSSLLETLLAFITDQTCKCIHENSTFLMVECSTDHNAGREGGWGWGGSSRQTDERSGRQSMQNLLLSLHDIMRQVTAVWSGCIKNWSCMQGKSCWASGHRRKVPYEKFNGTGDGARARLLFLLSFSTGPPCACSRRELAVLPVKVSGFLWMCLQDAVYWLSIYVRAALSVCTCTWDACAVQTEMPRWVLVALK